MSGLTKGIVVAVTLVVTCSGASAWQTNLHQGFNDAARAVGFDGSGNVVALGTLLPTGIPSNTPGFSVVKLSSVDGSELWRTDIVGTDGEGEGHALVVDPSGDVFAVGAVFNLFSNEDFCVVKLSGVDGSELWRHEIAGLLGDDDRALAVIIGPTDPFPSILAAGSIDGELVVVKMFSAFAGVLWRRPTTPAAGEAVAIGLDPANGLVAAAGFFGTVASTRDFGVIAFHPTSGNELWRQQIDGSNSREDHALGVAVDPADASVAAAGFLNNSGGADDDFFVVKFDAAGTELWRRTVAGTMNNDDVAVAVAVDGGGDVIAAGSLDNLVTDLDFTVLKLDGASGGVLWQRELDGVTSRDDVASAVQVDAAGDVIAAGRFENVTQDDFAVVKLSAAAGTELWRREINGDQSSDDEVLAVAVQGTDVAAAGVTRNGFTGDDFTVVKLSGVDGSGVDYHLLAGKRLVVRDKGGDSSRRTVRLVSEANLYIPPGSAGDPTVSGATLELINPVSGETDSFVLPSAQWVFRPASLQRVARYAYRDPMQLNGPCRRVVIADRRRLRAFCKGSLIAYSLDEATQGGIEVRLTMGTDPYPYCMHFGGSVRRDFPAMPDEFGIFRAVDAPARSCPVP